MTTVRTRELQSAVKTWTDRQRGDSGARHGARRRPPPLFRAHTAPRVPPSRRYGLRVGKGVGVRAQATAGCMVKNRPRSA